MGYINEDYYTNDYGGTEVSDDIDTLIERASEIIDIITGNGIARCGGFELLPSDFIKARVKLATAAQVDYLDRNGGLSSLDSSTPVQMTLGGFSYMNGSGTSERNSMPISPLAVSHLEATGLIYRGVGAV